MQLCLEEARYDKSCIPSSPLLLVGKQLRQLELLEVLEGFTDARVVVGRDGCCSSQTVHPP